MTTEELMLKATNWIAGGTIASALAAISAIIISVVIFISQKKINYKISNDQLCLTKEIHDSQKLLTQRQLLVPLWDYISNLSEINQNDPITTDVVKAIQTMELIAVCCEGEMIDKQVIIRTFMHDFIKLYNSIDLCGQVKGLNKTGRELLNDAKAASLFYDELKKLHLNSNSIK
jgi:hypothetical protein